MASVMAAPASASTASPDSHGPRGPQVVSNWLHRVNAGEAESVSVWFRGTDRRICDFKLHVRDTRQVEVSYPRHRRYASLSNGDTLVRGETDRATFRVEANSRRDASAFLTATVSYNDCGRHSRIQFKRFGLLLPIDGGHGGKGHDNGGGQGHDNGGGQSHDNDGGKGHDNGGGKADDKGGAKAPVQTY
jgi:hypothetical protein